MSNSKLYYAISKEISRYKEEFEMALKKYKSFKTEENKIKKEVAQAKFNTWQQAQNFLYTKSGSLVKEVK